MDAGLSSAPRACPRLWQEVSWVVTDRKAVNWGVTFCICWRRWVVVQRPKGWSIRCGLSGLGWTITSPLPRWPCCGSSVRGLRGAPISKDAGSTLCSGHHRQAMLPGCSLSLYRGLCFDSMSLPLEVLYWVAMSFLFLYFLLIYFHNFPPCFSTDSTGATWAGSPAACC